MNKYDYFVAGRWPNYNKVRQVLEKIGAACKSAYCFIDNEYDSDGIKQTKKPIMPNLIKNKVAHIWDWNTI